MIGPSDKPPAFHLLAREVLALALPAMAPVLPPVTCRGDAGGAPVLVFPGLLCSDAMTSRLRHSLETANFRTFGWELGLNSGLRPGLLEGCIARLASVHQECGAKVILLGWSLGGLYAREIAKQKPDLVRAVITMASPFSGNLHGNNAWRVYEWLNDHKVDELPLAGDLARKPPVPTVAVWSAADGIVSPEAARGQLGEADRTVEVHSTHMGMGVSAEAIRDIAAIALSCIA